MKLRRRPPRAEPGDVQGSWTLDQDTELFDPPGDGDPYPVREVHPALRTLARVGLWGAVAIGWLGGLAGLVDPGPGASAAPSGAAVEWEEVVGVPGAVASVAERAVVAWLGASDGEELNLLFVERPAVVDGDPVAVEGAATVAGEATGEARWAVIVAADVLVPAVDDDAEAESATWHVAVTVVGDERAGPRALATPALVPAPTGAGGWESEGGAASTLDADEPLAVMVTGFLQALVVGAGDPAPYLAGGVEVAPVRPVPFSDLEIVTLRASRSEDGATVWVEAKGTAGRGRYAVAYQVDVVSRGDRWQVTAVSGAAAVRDGDTSGDGEPGDGDSTGSGGGGPVPVDGGEPDGPSGVGGTTEVDGEDGGAVVPDPAGPGTGDEDGVGLDEEAPDDSIAPGPGA